MIIKAIKAKLIAAHMRSVQEAYASTVNIVTKNFTEFAVAVMQAAVKDKRIAEDLRLVEESLALVKRSVNMLFEHAHENEDIMKAWQEYEKLRDKAHSKEVGKLITAAEKFINEIVKE